MIQVPPMVKDKPKEQSVLLREYVLDRVNQYRKDSTIGIVGLVGDGGVGKTRVADLWISAEICAKQMHAAYMEVDGGQAFQPTGVNAHCCNIITCCG